MKLVIDTNVVISGIFWKGPPNKILIDWFDGKYEVFISAAILTEYDKVLKRMKSGLTPEEIQEWIELIITHSSITAPLEQLNIIEDDPDDNKFLECAIAAEADFIISGDKHLLNLGQYKDIKVLSPAEFLNQF